MGVELSEGVVGLMSGVIDSKVAAGVGLSGCKVGRGCEGCGVARFGGVMAVVRAVVGAGMVARLATCLYLLFMKVVFAISKTVFVIIIVCKPCSVKLRFTMVTY